VPDYYYQIHVPVHVPAPSGALNKVWRWLTGSSHPPSPGEARRRREEYQELPGGGEEGEDEPVDDGGEHKHSSFVTMCV